MLAFLDLVALGEPAVDGAGDGFLSGGGGGGDEVLGPGLVADADGGGGA